MSTYFIDGRKNIKTILAENVSLEGDLSFKESLEIRGNFVGTIKSQGLLIISKTATVKGSIYSKDLIIEGKVLGDILVYNRLSVEDRAEITGNITTHKLKVTNLVIIDGECSTLNGKEVEDMFNKVAPENSFRNTQESISEKIEAHNEITSHPISKKKLSISNKNKRK